MLLEALKLPSVPLPKIVPQVLIATRHCRFLLKVQSDNVSLIHRVESSMGKSRFRAFDAFQKTVEEARIRTASGGLVTLVSACIIFWLVVLEVWDWRRTVFQK